MELIPIIYTVLKIVVVLTIITLTVSYIGYRIRQKKGGPDTSNDENANYFQPIAKISTPVQPDLRPNEVRSVPKPNAAKLISKENEEKSSLKPVGSIQVSKPNESRQEKPKVKKKDDSSRRLSHKYPPKYKAEEHTERPKIQNERIAVIKKLSNQQIDDVITPSEKKKTIKTQANTLTDDILDKYMEDENSDMFTLKVKKNKENPKEEA
jgi:hypothetical protein